MVCALLTAYALYGGAMMRPSAPAGMKWIAGGEFDMGSDEPMFRDAQPVHRVYVDGFWIDEVEVTNAQFAEFVKATGYLTVAERVPNAKDYPGAKPDMLFAGSVVFSPPIIRFRCMITFSGGTTSRERTGVIRRGWPVLLKHA